MTSLTGKVVLIFNCFIKNKIITVVYDKKRRKKISLCVSNETNKPFTFYTEYILLFFENDTKTKANRTRKNANSIQQIIIGEIGPIAAILICYAHIHTLSWMEHCRIKCPMIRTKTAIKQIKRALQRNGYVGAFNKRQ